MIISISNVFYCLAQIIKIDTILLFYSLLHLVHSLPEKWLLTLNSQVYYTYLSGFFFLTIFYNKFTWRTWNKTFCR